MDLLAPVKAVDRFQQRHVPLAVLSATIKKFNEDRAGQLVAVLSYYAFLSVFPLLLVFVTILGYLLSGSPHLLHEIDSSVLGRFPVIGTSIKTGRLRGSVFALVIGVALSLYSGLGVTQSAHQAFDRIWEVQQGERPNALIGRLRGVVTLIVFGTVFIVASAGSGLVAGGLGGARTFLALPASLVLNLLLLGAAYRVLCSVRFAFGTLAPGVVIGALIWLGLQYLGGDYISHIQHSSDTYGAFALVIGVIAWLHIGALATLYCNELNVVLARRRWPRSLIGPDNQVVPRRDGLDERAVDAARKSSVV
jgi:YihY family inner membrane protein